MDVASLHRLSRALQNITLKAAAQDGDTQLTPSQLLVIDDVAHHAGTTVAATVKRTQLAQSQVSTIVTGYKKDGVFIVHSDKKDKRSVTIEVAPEIRNVIFKQRGAQPIQQALAELYPALSADQLLEFERLSQQLATLLNKSQA